MSEHPSRSARRRPPRRAGAALWSAALVALLLGCGGDDPTGPGDAVVQFAPNPGRYVAAPLDTLRFSARSSGGLVLPLFLRADGDSAGVGTEVAWVPGRQGLFVLQGVATPPGGEPDSARWEVEVVAPDSTLVPRATGLRVTPGPDPGTVEIRWEAPLPSLLDRPVGEYFLQVEEAAFAADAFDFNRALRVAHDPAGLLQTFVVRNRDEGLVLHARVAVVDVDGRPSPPSVPAEGRVTGSYDLEGVVYAVTPQDALPVPLPGVVVDVGGRRTLSDTGGVYRLLDLPDTRRHPAVVTAEQGGFHPFLSDTLEVQDATIDFHLFPQFDVEVLSQDGGGTVLYPAYQFLAESTRNTTLPYGLYGWGDYPVPVQVIDRVFQGSEEVDYGAAIREAIRRWNDAVGEAVFVEAGPDPPARGVEIAANLPSGGIILGDTVIMEPNQGKLYEVQPVRVRIRVLEGFNFQSVAVRILTHELGHALGLDHSPSAARLMTVSAPAESGGIPSVEEAWVARLLRHVEPGTDLRGYQLIPHRASR